MGRKKKKYIAKSPEKSLTQETHTRHRKFNLKHLQLLIGIIILALALRLLYIKQIISTPLFDGLVTDTEKYQEIALYILKGNFTHPSSIYLNPLYPFFLSLIYLIAGRSHLAVVIVQGIIDALSCGLIYYIASTLFNKRAGIIAALIYACYGLAIFYSGILLAPTIVIFFTLLFIASLLIAKKKSKIPIFFISGVFLGIVALATPNVTLFLFFLPLWWFTVLKRTLGVRNSILGFLLLLVGFLLVLSPMITRNYLIEKRLFYSILGGLSFYIGNNEKATGYFMSPYGVSITPVDQVKTSIRYAEKELGKMLNPSEASHYWFTKGLKFIKDNPLDALFLYLKKCALFWRKEEIPLNINYPFFSKAFAPIFKLPFISFGIIAPLALLGIFLSMRRKDDALLVTLFILSSVVSGVLFFVSDRYRLPVVPFLIVYSSYTICCFVEMTREKETKRIIRAAAMLIVLFAAINLPIDYLKTAPSSISYNNLGRIYNKQGSFDKAFVALKRALSIDPSFVEAHCNLGNTYFLQGLIDQAIEEYKNAAKIQPHYTLAHYNLGIAYNEKGLLEDAVTEYKQALAIDPNYPEAHNNLGLVYEKKGLVDEAISEYEKAVAINPNLEQAHNNLGRAYYAKKNYKLALLHCDKAVELGGRINPKLLESLNAYR